jgi:acetyltransferase-like isoleucine patch superfamily enzyme
MKDIVVGRLRKIWTRFWMRFAGLDPAGRLSMRLAAFAMPPNKGRIPLSDLSESGFIEYTAEISHPDLTLGKHCFIGDRVIINERRNGGAVRIGNRVGILRDSIIETGTGGKIFIDDFASIHPDCHIFAYIEPISIGKGVMIAPGCALFSYNHGISLNEPIRNQPLNSKGPIIIGDEAWIATHVTILHNVKIGKGAVIGAGSVVTGDIPDNAIAAGVPAKVIGFRS